MAGFARSVSGAKPLVSDQQETEQKILAFIREELQDKTIPFTMETPIEDVKIDSLDFIQVAFHVEEEFGVAVSLTQEAKFDTVGDFVTALIKDISEGKKLRS